LVINPPTQDEPIRGSHRATSARSIQRAENLRAHCKVRKAAKLIRLARPWPGTSVHHAPPEVDPGGRSNMLVLLGVTERLGDRISP
jgi:hypothetical protein